MSDVKISKREYDNLLKAQRKLQALENGGVDNWEWYSEALSELRKEEEFEYLLQEYTDLILEECSVQGDVEYPAGREAGHRILLDDAEDGVIQLLRKFYQEATKED